MWVWWVGSWVESGLYSVGIVSDYKLEAALLGAEVLADVRGAEARLGIELRLGCEGGVHPLYEAAVCAVGHVGFLVKHCEDACP